MKRHLNISFIIKYIILTAVIAVAVLLAGCNNRNVALNGSWSRYDGDLNETIIMSFDENGGYSYYCECREHTKAYDSYNKYSYNADSRTITLSGSNGVKKEIRLLYKDNFYLCTELDNGAYTFKSGQSPVNGDLPEAAGNYINDNMLCLSVLGFENNRITVATYNYDKDAHQSFADTVFELEADENIDFSSVTVTVENGVQALEYSVLSEEERGYIGEDYCWGYVEIGQNGRVTSVVFYGTLEINY